MSVNSTALITGATGGFGKALCREFVRHGYDLVITARNPERLRQVAGSLKLNEGQKVTAIPADLNQADGAKVLVEKTRGAGIEVDVLVNNAGFGLGGEFVGSRPKLQDAMIRVNMTAPTHLCRLLVPGMLRRGRGGVINVCSTGGFVAGPYNNIYCASKAYLLHFTEGLAEELRESPVQVMALCPGAMRTGFARRAGMEDTLLFQYGVMDPEEVAQAGYAAFVQGKTVFVAGALNRAAMVASRLLPRTVGVKVSGIMQRPKRTGGN